MVSLRIIFFGITVGILGGGYCNSHPQVKEPQQMQKSTQDNMGSSQAWLRISQGKNIEPESQDQTEPEADEDILLDDQINDDLHNDTSSSTINVDLVQKQEPAKSGLDAESIGNENKDNGWILETNPSNPYGFGPSQTGLNFTPSEYKKQNYGESKTESTFALAVADEEEPSVPKKISDGGSGGCSIPHSWRLGNAPVEQSQIQNLALHLMCSVAHGRRQPILDMVDWQQGAWTTTINHISKSILIQNFGQATAMPYQVVFDGQAYRQAYSNNTLYSWKELFQTADKVVISIVELSATKCKVRYKYYGKYGHQTIGAEFSRRNNRWWLLRFYG